MQKASFQALLDTSKFVEVRKAHVLGISDHTMDTVHCMHGYYVYRLYGMG